MKNPTVSLQLISKIRGGGRTIFNGVDTKDSNTKDSNTKDSNTKDPKFKRPNFKRPNFKRPKDKRPKFQNTQNHPDLLRLFPGLGLIILSVTCSMNLVRAKLSSTLNPVITLHILRFVPMDWFRRAFQDSTALFVAGCPCTILPWCRIQS